MLKRTMTVFLAFLVLSLTVTTVALAEGNVPEPPIKPPTSTGGGNTEG